jgi:hypothetical protein
MSQKRTYRNRRNRRKNRTIIHKKKRTYRKNRLSKRMNRKTMYKKRVHRTQRQRGGFSLNPVKWFRKQPNQPNQHTHRALGIEGYPTASAPTPKSKMSKFKDLFKRKHVQSNIYSPWATDTSLGKEGRGWVDHTKPPIQVPYGWGRIN